MEHRISVGIFPTEIIGPYPLSILPICDPLYIDKSSKKVSNNQDLTFDEFTGAINHAGCRENTRKVCKSRGSRAVRRVIYTLFECSLNIPSALLRR